MLGICPNIDLKHSNPLFSELLILILSPSKCMKFLYATISSFPGRLSYLITIIVPDVLVIYIYEISTVPNIAYVCVSNTAFVYWKRNESVEIDDQLT